MAGIGFVLRKLASQDNLSGVIRAYYHSAIVAVGPWILIVLSVGTLLALSSSFLSLRELNEFLAIFIYNLCFSFIMSGSLYMISARYVSDCLYLRQLDPIPGILTVSLYILILLTLPWATFFYVYFTTMTPFSTILSIINFFLLCQTWVTMLFLGLLRDFRAITLSWIVGMLLTIFLSLYFGSIYRIEGLLIGINIGLCFLVASLTAHVLAEYPYPYERPINFEFYFRYYRELFWSGLFFFASMWIDKIIMWASPEAVTHLNSLRTYPVYDGAMFLSYLSIIPVMALFTFSLETNFYDSYIHYIRCIENNSPYSAIEEERQAILSKIAEDARSFLVLQGAISLIVVLFAPQIFMALGVDYLELSIFRLGTVGAFFAALNFFMVVIFSYFDSQDNMFKLTGMMLISNIIMTLISLYLGFPFYGYGFCFSMILSFFVGSLLFVNFLNNLTYHIFITNTVKRQVIREKYQQRPIFTENIQKSK
jgi:polysaccharide biosynthesis protein PelG